MTKSSALPLGLKDHADRITAAYGKGRDNMLEIATACALATTEYPRKSDLKHLTDLLPASFTSSKLSKYGKIGNAKWMHHPKIRDSIPHEYSVAYYLASIDETSAKAMIASGKIHQNLSRKEAEALAGNTQGRRSKSRLQPRRAIEDHYAVILLASPVKESVKGKVDSALEAIASLEGITIQHPWEAIQEQNQAAETDRQEKLQKTFISLAKKLVRETTEKRYRRDQPKNLSRRMTKKEFLDKIGWKEDEILIEDHDDNDRIRDVLSFIDREDEFDRLWQEAEVSVPEAKYLDCAGDPEVIADVHLPLPRPKRSALRFDDFKFDDDSSRTTTQAASEAPRKRAASKRPPKRGKAKRAQRRAA